MRDVDVVIIGGGVAGLSADATLRASGLRTVVLEQDASGAGGRVKTIDLHGAPVELGAAFLADFYHDAIELLRNRKPEVLVPRDTETYVVRAGSPLPAWPVDVLAKSSLLTLGSKLRLLSLCFPMLYHWRHLDSADLGRSRNADSRSIRQVCQTWAGSAGTASFIEPLLRGLFYWDIGTTTQVSILMMLKEASRGLDLFRVAGGLRTLVGFASEGATLILDAKVMSTEACPEGVRTRALVGGAEEVFTSRGAVLATTADVALKVASGMLSPEVTRFLASVGYSRTTCVVLRSDAVDVPSGTLLFERDESPFIVSVNPVSADNGSTNRTVCVFLSTAGHDETEGLEADELGDFCRAELSRLLDKPAWLGTAIVAAVQRWPRALPNFAVGQIKTMTEVRPDLPIGGRLALAGDYLGGPHIGGAMLSGRIAGEKLAAALPV
ncbi:MAG: protoporphyrinogen/coproporphyrinogen oxidase [Gammaproteobacteria bacterium]